MPKKSDVYVGCAISGFVCLVGGIFLDSTLEKTGSAELYKDRESYSREYNLIHLSLDTNVDYTFVRNPADTTMYLSIDNFLETVPEIDIDVVKAEIERAAKVYQEGRN